MTLVNAILLKPAKHLGDYLNHKLQRALPLPKDGDVKQGSPILLEDKTPSVDELDFMEFRQKIRQRTVPRHRRQKLRLVEASAKLLTE